MEVNFTKNIVVPDDVMIRELGGEAVILNLRSETYFGLDDVAMRMWTRLTESSSIQAAFNLLLDEYHIDENQLRGDLTVLLQKLTENGLLVLMDAEGG